MSIAGPGRTQTRVRRDVTCRPISSRMGRLVTGRSWASVVPRRACAETSPVARFWLFGSRSDMSPRQRCPALALLRRDVTCRPVSGWMGREVTGRSQASVVPRRAFAETSPVDLYPPGWVDWWHLGAENARGGARGGAQDRGGPPTATSGARAPVEGVRGDRHGSGILIGCPDAPTFPPTSPGIRSLSAPHGTLAWGRGASEGVIWLRRIAAFVCRWNNRKPGSRGQRDARCRARASRHPRAPHRTSQHPGR